MGKKSKSKKGVNTRARKRANEAATELAEDIAVQVSTKGIKSKTDADLFVLDTSGDKSALTHVPKKQRFEEKEKRPKNRLSEKDKRMVKRILEVQGEEGAVSLASEGREILARRRGNKRVAGTARANFDLWGDGKTCSERRKKKAMVSSTGVAAMAGMAPVQVVVRERTFDKKGVPAEVGVAMPEQAALSNKLKKTREVHMMTARPAVAVELAHAGQSYRPDPEAHQDVIGEALAVEIRRNDAIEYKTMPISQGLSEETLALLVHSDDEISSDEDDSDEEMRGEEYRPKLKKEKLTRAQRNKQKRVKAERVALEKRRQEKRLLASVSEVKKYGKAIAREEADKAERREKLSRLKAEKKVEPLGTDMITKLSSEDPINAPSLAVALTSELAEQGGGTLRTVRPKGSLITDRIQSMADRKLANRKALRKKNIVEGKKRKMKGGKHREYLLI